MSKYPDNPLWCDAHDQPIALTNSDDWEEAKRSGYLTVEHIVARLEDILEYALDGELETGYDEEGFLRALVADGYLRNRGVTVRLHSRDHPPPHAHIEIKGHPD